MRIGIIGAGNVGGALGTGWAKAGHEVIWGVRDPRDPKHESLVLGTRNGALGTVTEAADAGEVLVLTTPWNATRAALDTLGDVGGKPLLDATNPLKPDLSGLDLPPGTSGGEQVQAWCPHARVVKVFNTTGADNMNNPAYPGGATTMLYCGDDPDAKKIAHQLSADLGFAPLDAGPLSRALLLEDFALLWITLAYGQNMGRDFAFRIERRQ